METPTKQEAIFAKGLMFRRPHEGAPEFIKGKMSVNAKEFFTWVKENPQYLSEKGWINFDLKLSKNNGTLYFQVDTWKPTKKEVDSEDLNIPF